MKSKIVLTSVAALLVSVAGANALEYRPFIGATIGLQGALYSDDAKDIEHTQHIDFPTDFFAFGLETGVRVGSHAGVYNGGITVSATKSTYSDVEYKYSEKRLASSDLFNISATYDSYIRVSGDKARRIDLVLGAGAGAMAYHIDPIDDVDETIWSFAPEFKIGMDFELTKHITLSANFRTLVPMRNHYIAEGSYITGGVFKYIF